MSLYFKKETAGWQKPEREAALVSLGEGKFAGPERRTGPAAMAGRRKGNTRS